MGLLRMKKLEESHCQNPKHLLSTEKQALTLGSKN